MRATANVSTQTSGCWIENEGHRVFRNNYGSTLSVLKNFEMYPQKFEDVHIEDSDKLVCRRCHVDYRDHYFSLLHPLSECYGNLHRRSTRAAELREAGLYVEPPPPFTVQVNSQDQDVEMGSIHSDSDDDDDDDSNGNDDDDDNQSLEIIIGPLWKSH